MAEKLSVRIALEGGAEIEKQLAGIGKAGQQAFLDIANAAQKAGGIDKLDPKEVEDKFKKLGITAPAEINKITEAVKSAGRLETLVSGIVAVEAGFAGAAVAAGAFVAALGPISIALAAIATVAATVGKAALGAAADISKIDAEAIKLDTTIERLDKLRLGFEKVGLSASAVSSGIKSAFDVFDNTGIGQAIKDVQEWGRTASDAYKKVQAAAAKGNAAAQAQLEKMGDKDPVTQIIDDIGKRSNDTATRIDLVIQRLQLMDDTAMRTALAIRVFGQEAGTAIVQALRTGSIEQYMAAQRQQAALTQEQANTAARLEQAQNRLASSWARFSSLTFAPALTAGLNYAASVIDMIGAKLATVDWASWGATAAAALNAIAGPGAALISGLVAVAEAIGGTAVAAWQMFASAAQAALDMVNAGLAALAGAWNTVADAALSAINMITGAIAVVVGKISAAIGALARFVGMTGGGGAGVPQGPGFAGGGLMGGRGTGTSDSNFAWLSRGEHVMPARVVAQPGVLALLEALRLSRFAQGGLVGPPRFASGGLVGKLAETAAQALTVLDHACVQIIDTAAQMKADIRSLANAFGLFASNASGGLIGGRGTGTSDSNLAWVSRGEHIMPARAVAQPGVLALLEALRRSGGNLSGVLDRLGHFALGGLVGPMAVPAFAGGGVNGMSHVTIAFPGLPAIGGLRASSAVVEELQRAAAMAQVRSGGRKPSRYG